MSINMSSSFNKNEDKWVFLPVGEIDIDTSTRFQEEILEKYETKKKDILIDGEKLDYIDSTGLGALIYILKNLKEDGFQIYLMNIKPNILKLFKITELDKLFVIRGVINE